MTVVPSFSVKSQRSVIRRQKAPESNAHLASMFTSQPRHTWRRA